LLVFEPKLASENANNSQKRMLCRLKYRPP
jgi:hypothetical protein